MASTSTTTRSATITSSSSRTINRRGTATSRLSDNSNTNRNRDNNIKRQNSTPVEPDLELEIEVVDRPRSGSDSDSKFHNLTPSRCYTHTDDRNHSGAIHCKKYRSDSMDSELDSEQLQIVLPDEGQSEGVELNQNDRGTQLELQSDSGHGDGPEIDHDREYDSKPLTFDSSSSEDIMPNDDDEDDDESTSSAKAKKRLKRSSGKGFKSGNSDEQGEEQDERAEKNRLSAKECRIRKKLRYQYLAELIAHSEDAVFKLRNELQEVCLIFVHKLVF